MDVVDGIPKKYSVIKKEFFGLLMMYLCVRNKFCEGGFLIAALHEMSSLT